MQYVKCDPDAQTSPETNQVKSLLESLEACHTIKLNKVSRVFLNTALRNIINSCIGLAGICNYPKSKPSVITSKLVLQAPQ